MFHIFPIQEATTHKDFAARCGAHYRPDLFAYGMTDAETGALMGISQFELGDGEGVIFDLRPKAGTDDAEAMFILGRTTMSFIEKIGVTDCYAAADAGDPRLLRRIGFQPCEREGYLFCDLRGMFDGHCSGKPVKL